MTHQIHLKTVQKKFNVGHGSWLITGLLDLDSCYGFMIQDVGTNYVARISKDGSTLLSISTVQGGTPPVMFKEDPALAATELAQLAFILKDCLKNESLIQSAANTEASSLPKAE